MVVDASALLAILLGEPVQQCAGTSIDALAGRLGLGTSSTGNIIDSARTTMLMTA
jgi:hypothetical protein